MKVTINATTFKKMLNALKGSTAYRYAPRPSLEYIRIQAENGNITATACDGYSAARFKSPAISHEGEDFTCLIKPVDFKVNKYSNLCVTIELADNIATLEIPAEYGNIAYNFKQTCVWDTKLDETIDKMKAHDREVGVDASFMARIMKNFANVIPGGRKCVVIESKDNPREGFRMYAEKEEFEFEQFLLPMKMNK